jgi:hypothetical protein
MAVRSRRGRVGDQVRRWFLGRFWWWFTQPAAGQYKLHDAVPRHWPALPDALRRPHESGQDGAAVLASGRSQEPCRYRLVGQAGS